MPADADPAAELFDLEYEWRRDRLLELGVDSRTAASLALNGVDWHAAEELVLAGCPTELLPRLLLPFGAL